MNDLKKMNVASGAGLAVARSGLLALVLLAATVIGTAVPAVSHAQATSGSIVGHAPAGDTILIEGAGGVKRKTKVKENGRYAVRALPLGMYMVTLLKNGDVRGTRYGVQLRPGGTGRVNFACKNDHCSANHTSSPG